MDEEQASRPKRTVPPVLSPAVLVAALAVAAYLTAQAPLETARPKADRATLEPPPPSVPEIGAAHARLWEDPLLSAYEARQNGRGAPEARWEAYRDIVEALTGADWPSAIQEHFGNLAKDERNKHLVVMPVLVPGEPYAEHRELRMRTRYAVLAALGRCGYELALPTRMSYVTVPVRTDFSVVGQQVRKDVVVPVKLYRRKLAENASNAVRRENPTDSQGVLVLWINEGQLSDRPLNAVSQILNRMFPRDPSLRKTIRVAMVGPTSSDGLQAMLRERVLEKEKKTSAAGRGLPCCRFEQFEKPQLLSPRATVWEHLLPEELQLGPDRSVRGVQVIRVVGSDDLLVEELCSELRLRNAWPAESDGAKAPKEHVVLIFERDTLYGRSLRETMEKLKTPGANKRILPPGHLHVFTYLRGIDGMLHGDQGDRPDQKKKSEEPRGEGGPDGRLPEGRSQYDYLRRLETQIAELDNSLDHAGKGRITAIGVVGTDFYDKLLVLRAIRRCFPRAFFFTTDVEAGYSHPREYRYTRNLIVASHFGLQLHPRLQGDVAPFRDCYQTATFLAVLLAVGGPDVQSDLGTLDRDDPWAVEGSSFDEHRHLRPLVFEIGRSGPYQLTMTGGQPGFAASPGSWQQRSNVPASAVVHPTGPRERPWLWRDGWRLSLLVLGLLAIAGCVACYGRKTRTALAFLVIPFAYLPLLLLRTSGRCLRKLARTSCEARPRWRRLLQRTGRQFRGWGNWHAQRAPSEKAAAWALFLLTLIVLILAIWDDRRVNGEPVTLLQGISAWPSTLLRYVAGVLAVWFLFKGFRDLDRNLAENCGPLLGIAQRQGGGIADPHPCASLRVCLWGRWPVAAPADNFTAQHPKVPADALYEQYASVEKPGRRLARILLAMTLYAVFAILLFAVTGESSNRPYRGSVSSATGYAVLIVSVLAMALLVFFVIDATHFCRRLVRRLAEDVDKWPSEGIQKARAALCAHETPQKEDLPSVREDDLKELLTVRLIARRTRAVGKLMYYPCIILF